jgi:hypothetical protein
VNNFVEEIRYLVNEGDDGFYSVTAEGLERVMSRTGSGPLSIAYITSLGFNIPDNQELGTLTKRLAESSNREVLVDPIFGDTNHRYGKNPFSPIQVHVVYGRGVIRRKVADSRKTPVSAQDVDIERITEAYKGLGFGHVAEPLIEQVKDKNPESLGEFLLYIHDLILEQQIGHDISVGEPRYDTSVDYMKRNPRIDNGRDHDVLWIGLHPLTNTSLSNLSKDFTTAREEGTIGDTLRMIVTPEHPQTYFRM